MENLDGKMYIVFKPAAKLTSTGANARLHSYQAGAHTAGFAVHPTVNSLRVLFLDALP